MKNKKVNKIVTLAIIAVLVLVAIIVFILNFTGEDSELTLLEKKWITDNTNKVVDINVFNDIPVYGSGGNGVIFDFLNSFTEEYKIEFNRISYYSTTENPNYSSLAFKILNNTDSISENQILFYKDCYVIANLNKTNTIYNIDDIEGKIGILSPDKNDVLYHLAITEKEIEIYDDIETMLKSLKEEKISYIIVPSIMYMDKIVSNNLNIIYHISDISKKYVLEIQDKNLYSIMNKYYIDFKNNYFNESFSNQFLDIYFKNSEYTEVDRVNYNSSVYTYGYVVNMPYENMDDGNFVGVLSNYLKEFQTLAKVDLKIVKYKTIEELKTALLMGDVDFAFANFDVSTLGSSFTTTNEVVDFNYVILSPEYENIRDITSLKEKTVSVVSNSKMANLLKDKNINIKEYENTDDLMRNIDNNTIIAIDKNMYDYYKNGKLKNYKLVYETSENSTPFVISGKNKVFSSLFSYYISIKDYHDFRFEYHTTMGIDNNNKLEILTVVSFCIIFTIILLLIGLIIKKKKNKKKKNIMDDKMKFIDVMTSLKNRNYLNYSIPKWDENVIYPQAIVVVDLNNLKDINDNYGHEKGDEVIKKAANILISNQIEKTDLVRTDGNEFLIYMVGYDDKEVVSYAKKIYKEFKDLPYGFGASIGYSMIEDDVKTIDDAINEAVIDMRKNKDNEKK